MNHSTVIDNGNVNSIALDDRWTPKLNGSIFCSPACGFGCKKADFDHATQRASALANKLGSGWQPHVWENGGWHFEVTKSAAIVSFEEEGLYQASIRFSFDDRVELCISESRGDPREAIEAVTEVLNRRVATLTRTLLSVSIAPAEIQDV
jgi:hypothetical protein